MLIKILETCRISEDGFIVRRLHKDEEIELAHTAACTLIAQGKAYNCGKKE